ncbi:hypothetical protein GCK32_022901, partial [Trichostrongylus colubriformis]
MNLRPKDKAWLTDRVNDFDDYLSNTESAKRKMGKLFNVSCSTLAALATMYDDTAVRWVTLAQPPGARCPIRFDFTLDDMAQDSGWNRGRMVDFWITGAEQTTQMRVDSVLHDLDTRQLSVRVTGFTWNHATLTRLVSEHGRTVNDHRVIDGYVRLGKLTKSANAANEAVSRMLHIVERVEQGTIGHRILDAVYRKPAPAAALPTTNASQPTSPHPFPDTFRVNQQTITLTTDQRASLELGLANHPIAEIQAVFGTGKTVLGAIIAGLLVQRKQGPLIVTATTNNAVAHFANTMLSIEEFRNVRLLRYLSEAAFLDESPSTPVDIHEILKSLPNDFGESLNEEQRELCSRFRRGRLIYEQYARNPDRATHMSESEIDEYILAEQDVS